MRTHVILVPGFGGFDALGQLNYYSGVTNQFAAWLANQPGDRARGVLHYFDNLPTAAVSTRGAMLARYLKRLVERRVIQGADDVVLVGHSTGGLDIRQMIRDLADAAVGAGDPAARANRRDDAAVDARRAGELLARIQRLVFLSVPHHGTSLADWVGGNRIVATVAIAVLRRAMGLRVAVPLGPFEKLLGGFVPGDAQLLDAVEDARRDLDPTDPDALALADARRARAEIELWLAHTDSDFLAIDDLASARPAGTRIVETPERDAALWAAHRITTRSYATIGADPTPGRGARSPGPVPSRLRSMWAVVRAMRSTDSSTTDFVYRVAHAMCSGGLFAAAPVALPRLDDPAKTRTIERWHNDGVVNTLAMLPPDGVLPFLVDGDHADVIGHFERRARPNAAPGGRRYETYDLFGSGSGFDAARFAAVWDHLFDFAVPASPDERNER